MMNDDLKKNSGRVKNNFKKKMNMKKYICLKKKNWYNDINKLSNSNWTVKLNDTTRIPTIKGGISMRETQVEKCCVVFFLNKLTKFRRNFYDYRRRFNKNQGKNFYPKFIHRRQCILTKNASLAYQSTERTQAKINSKQNLMVLRVKYDQRCR